MEIRDMVFQYKQVHTQTMVPGCFGLGGYIPTPTSVCPTVNKALVIHVPPQKHTHTLKHDHICFTNNRGIDFLVVLAIGSVENNKTTTTTFRIDTTTVQKLHPL
jgi:hypothetical protein